VLTEFIHVLCQKRFHLVAISEIKWKLVIVIGCIKTRSVLYQISTTLSHYHPVTVEYTLSDHSSTRQFFMLKMK